METTVIRLRRLYGELAYAQRRCIELRTGVPLTGPTDRSRRSRRQISELNALLTHTG